MGSVQDTMEKMMADFLGNALAKQVPSYPTIQLSYDEHILMEVSKSFTRVTKEGKEGELMLALMTFMQKPPDPKDLPTVSELRNIKYYSEWDWNESEEALAERTEKAIKKEEKQKDDLIFPSSIGTKRTVRDSQAQGPYLWLEELDGSVAKMGTVSEIRDGVRLFAKSLRKVNLHPSSWGELGHALVDRFCWYLSSKQPLVGYCKDYWKARKIASLTYSDWYRKQPEAVKAASRLQVPGRSVTPVPFECDTSDYTDLDCSNGGSDGPPPMRTSTRGRGRNSAPARTAKGSLGSHKNSRPKLTGQQASNGSADTANGDGGATEGTQSGVVINILPATSPLHEPINSRSDEMPSSR